MQLVIDLSRLRGNIRRIRAKLPVRFCAVVKAQAYGHGAAVAPYIEPVSDCFAVATCDEAAELAVTGVTKPILVLGGELKECLYFSEYIPQIIPTVSTAKEASLFISAGKRNFSVAVNTGMNRLGARGAELDEIVNLCKSNGVKPWSVYSHIYGGMSSAGEQATAFDTMTRDRMLCGNRHLYCSCALDLTENYMFDMVRMGIAMYGYSDCTDIALTARARIVEIARVERGSHVGYGDFVLDRDALVATVRCGYADGFRRCDKPLYMTVRGVKCPVLGQPCMDLTMIDVSNAVCRVGEYAYVIKEKADAMYLANVYGTIVYEVLTGFNGRAERMYV